MSRVYKPIRVEVTGGYGYGYGFAFSYPRKTRTRDTGVTGVMCPSSTRHLNHYPPPHSPIIATVPSSMVTRQRGTPTTMQKTRRDGCVSQ